MKCNASPTTSTAVDAAPASAGSDEAAEREATKAFEGLVTSMIVKPISDSMGPMGGLFGDIVARAAIARNGDSS